MDRFGFNSTPAIDLPADEVYKSGVFDEADELLGASDPVDLARVAIGQERLAGDAAADGRGRRRGRQRRQADEAADLEPRGRPRRPRDRNASTPPSTVEPISAETAAELTTAMEGVVSEGTGTNAAISGRRRSPARPAPRKRPCNEACGGGSEENQAWFIGFAPADDPQIAIAATVECTERVRRRRRGADLPRRRGNDPERRMR